MGKSPASQHTEQSVLWVSAYIVYIRWRYISQKIQTVSARAKEEGENVD